MGSPTSASSVGGISWGTGGGGDLNIVVVGWFDTTSTVSSVVDSRGNTYSLAIGPTSGNVIQQSIYYAKNILAGNNTVTANISQSVNHLGMWVFEYSGIAPTGVVDREASQQAPSATQSLSTPTITTTQGNDLLFAGFADSQGNGPSPAPVTCKKGWTRTSGR